MKPDNAVQLLKSILNQKTTRITRIRESVITAISHIKMLESDNKRFRKKIRKQKEKIKELERRGRDGK